MSDYTWTKENGLAVLRQPYHGDVMYNATSLNVALANVVAARTSYITQSDYERDLKMFAVGLALLQEHDRTAHTTATEGAKL